MNRNRDVAVAALKGAAAGVAATWIMNQVTTQLYNYEGDAARERENRARQGKTAYGVAADKIARFGGVALTDHQRGIVGQAIHWSIGAAGGAAYAALRSRWPSASSLRGVPFGIGFFLVFDELLNPVLGLTPGPRAFPWQAHARGMAGHLTYGAATELALEALDRVA